ncbi:MAG: hypothetical protein GX638_00680 [Crenarchaeota archaeon]|nr:hypothetical protein [Thermoproteota archaeon]
MRTGYKVVVRRRRKDGIKYYSSVMNFGYNRIAMVEYKLNEWAYPRRRNFGPLAVFKDKESAMKFVRFVTDSVAFKCKYRKSKKKRLYYMYDQCQDPPLGTDFASSVMLLEKVDRRKR